MSALLNRRRSRGALPLRLAIGLGIALAAGGCSALERKLSAELLQPRPALELDPAVLGWNSERVQISAGGDRQLAGLFLLAHSRPAPAVLLLHGSRSSSSHLHPYSTLLLESGYHVLAVDYAGYGASPGPLSVAQTAYDVPRALEWLGGQGQVEAVAVLGVSMGSIYALRAAADSAAVAGVVVENAISPRTELELWRERTGSCSWIPWLVRQVLLPRAMEPQDNAARLACPLLVVQGLTDRAETAQVSRSTLAACDQPALGWFPEQAGHAPEPLGRWPQTYRLLVADFLGRCFAAREGRPVELEGLVPRADVDRVRLYHRLRAALAEELCLKRRGELLQQQLEAARRVDERITVELASEAARLAEQLLDESEERALGLALLEEAVGYLPRPTARHWWAEQGSYRIGLARDRVDWAAALDRLQAIYVQRKDARALAWLAALRAELNLPQR